MLKMLDVLDREWWNLQSQEDCHFVDKRRKTLKSLFLLLLYPPPERANGVQVIFHVKIFQIDQNRLQNTLFHVQMIRSGINQRQLFNQRN
jgi:hypothetical protein